MSTLIERLRELERRVRELEGRPLPLPLQREPLRVYSRPPLELQLAPRPSDMQPEVICAHRALHP